MTKPLIQRLRRPRLFGIAMFDLFSSMLGTMLIFVWRRQRSFKKLPLTPFIIYGLYLAIPLGIFFHVVFGTNTTLNYNLGLSYKPNN